MSNTNNIEESDSLLPFGENIRPLLASSSLSENDLRHLLHRRGIFLKRQDRNTTVPHISSLLLSPKEFDILRNRQTTKESNIKRTSAQSEWIGGSKNICEVFGGNLENLIKSIIETESTYALSRYNTTFTSPNRVVIEGELRRNDWTRDVFSITTHHKWKVVIEKHKNNNIIEFARETTAPETKEFTSNLFQAIHKHFQSENVISSTQQLQRILATNFTENRYIFDYLFAFTQEKYSTIAFQRVIDIATGIDNRYNFPDKFIWLQGNIREVRLTALQGKKIEETDIVELAKIGILIFGEIDTEFTFNLTNASGRCIFRFGFPKFYDKRTNIEFETKIIRLDVDSQYQHISKDSIKRQLLIDFQKNKHQLFEQFKGLGKVDTDPKTLNKQFILNFPAI